MNTCPLTLEILHNETKQLIMIENQKTIGGPKENQQNVWEYLVPAMLPSIVHEYLNLTNGEDEEGNERS